MPNYVLPSYISPTELAKLESRARQLSKTIGHFITEYKGTPGHSMGAVNALTDAQQAVDRAVYNMQKVHRKKP